MKNMIIGIFTAIMLLIFLQPITEFANILKEKVTLDAAVLNACRAARNNALLATDMRDLNAGIDGELFIAYFSIAFMETLNLESLYSSGGEHRFKSLDSRWNPIIVRIDHERNNSDDINGRMVSKAVIQVETTYIFRTSLFKMVYDVSGNNLSLIETRQFIIQIIN